MEKGEATELRVLLFQEGEHWVAQGLEYDVGAQGKTIDDALYEMQRVLLGQIVIRQELDLPPFETAVPRAPALYWRQFEQANPVEKTPPHMTAGDRIPVQVNGTRVYEIAA